MVIDLPIQNVGVVWYNQALLLKAIYWEAFSKSEDIIYNRLLSMSTCSHL